MGRLHRSLERALNTAGSAGYDRKNRVMDEEHSPLQHVLVLRWREPERNVACFYALMIEGDLFGRIVLVRHWARVGSRRRERVDLYANQDEAVTAMGKLAAAKGRRGYRDL